VVEIVKKPLPKKKKEPPIKVSSYEEAEKIIYEQIKAGKNIREILQMEFSINGVEKKYNPYQIKKIKEKFEPNNESNNKDPDKASVFALLKKGFSPCDVVIKTNLSPEFVQKTYQEFLEFEGKQVVPKQTIQNLLNLGTTYARCNNLQDLHWLLKGAIANAKDFFKLNFNCVGCGQPLFIDDELIEAARKYLEKHWRHNTCWEN